MHPYYASYDVSTAIISMWTHNTIDRASLCIVITNIQAVSLQKIRYNIWNSPFYRFSAHSTPFPTWLSLFKIHKKCVSDTRHTLSISHIWYLTQDLLTVIEDSEITFWCHDMHWETIVLTQMCHLAKYYISVVRLHQVPYMTDR